MRLLWKLVRAVLFRLDAEHAHRLTVAWIRMLHRLAGPLPLKLVSGASERVPSVETAPRILGLPFQGRVGLAAGFDKDAELLTALPALGFGFVEIGTVTPRPQPGNPRPRLFRDVQERKIFNRMGFNGAGGAEVARRVAEARPDLPGLFRVGVNIGKNKDTALDLAHRDYAAAARFFEGLADYLVINVSSPNTPGLRSLQVAEALRPIVSEVQGVVGGWKRKTPIFMKLAPELTGAPLAEVIQGGESWGIDGWVLTNTWGGTISGPQGELSGGWSGANLSDLARARLIEARALTRAPIISVGGIMDENEGVKRIAEGADLIQLYSGWIFGGPALPAKISAKIREIRL